jgi:hypothetical protein
MMLSRCLALLLGALLVLAACGDDDGQPAQHKFLACPPKTGEC